jgi:hypothetical protein
MSFHCHFDPEAGISPGDVKAILLLHRAWSHPHTEKFHSIFVMAERLITGLPPGVFGLSPGQSMWDLWQLKWHWERFFS